MRAFVWPRRIVTMVLLLVASACATVPLPPIEAGKWTLQAPDQAAEVVEIRLLRAGEYYINAAGHPVAGVYRLEGSQLSMVKPDNPRMAGIVWQLNADRSLTLVQEPPVALSGRRLISAQMIKQP